MKINIYNKVIITLLTTLLLISCDDNDNSVGVAILPQQDQIILSADTFHISSEDYYIEAISAQTDSFIIGDFYTPKYGSTKAELLVQFAPPIDYTFPSKEYNPTPDSLVLMMYYNTWLGSPNAPLEFSIYELNKQSIDYNQFYWSNLNIGDYTDSTNLMGKRLVTSVDQSRVDTMGNDTAITPYIKYKFNDTQLKRFYDIAKDKKYDNIPDFLNEFKGLYITTRYGSSTLIYLNRIDMRLNYHYTYKKNGKDTIVNTSIIYPANKEVRQLNRYYHNDIANVAQHHDSINYIKSTAGIYPKLQIPLGRINQRLQNKIGDKTLNINTATIEVECIEYDDKDVYINPPSFLLALTENEYEDFIRHNTIPTSTDTNRVAAIYNVPTNSYSIDMSYFMTKYLRKGDIAPDETIDMILIPVEMERVTSGKQTSITKIKPLAMLSAVTIRSGKNEYSPMRMKILYNGF